MSARRRCSSLVRSAIRRTWRRGRTISSNGHTAQYGTRATKAAFSHTRRSWRGGRRGGEVTEDQGSQQTLLGGGGELTEGLLSQQGLTARVGNWFKPAEIQ